MAGLFEKQSTLKNGQPFWKHVTEDFYFYAYEYNPKFNVYNWHVSKKIDFLENQSNRIVWGPYGGTYCPYANGTSWGLNHQLAGTLDSSSFRVSELGERKNLISVRFVLKSESRIIPLFTDPVSQEVKLRSCLVFTQG